MGFLPVRPIDYGVDAYTTQIDAKLLCQRNLLGHIFDPCTPATTDMARFRQQDGSAVALVDLVQESVERRPPRMIQMPPEAVALDFPLVAVIIIDSHQVEKMRFPAQFRLDLAAEHVPGGKLAFPVGNRAFIQFRTFR